ncbi:hypothetical protein IBL26_05120 [Roseomonas aerophila]|uniref:SH3 domain-containing protein n=1 Tax=Teichococcus aerophilus TaxID=1224513 RepID=A0ABR7RI18_9PROT|nr:hypothetical protein [Pseudoroseomonas aerophila]MBC9206209.1 hypothetical protein [Pseudoroseomonas aerophila]
MPKLAWLACLPALASLAAPEARADPPISGQYGGLTLAVSGDRVSGVFSEGRAGNGSDAAPQFSCRFLLRGQLSGGRGIVQTWYPGEEAIPGNLSFESGRASLMLRENHDGCLMTSGDMTQQPYSSVVNRQGEGWVDVALVKADRAAFRPAPGAPAPRAPYVVEGDPLVVLEQRGSWVRARYVAGSRAVTGWLPISELELASPGSP